jgi:hypothetical protein
MFGNRVGGREISVSKKLQAGPASALESSSVYEV